MKRRIKRTLLIIMFFGIANALLGYANNGKNILKIGDIAPNFLLPDQEGCILLGVPSLKLASHN